VEPAAAEFQAQEMQVEETAGLGFGVTLLFFISVAAATAKKRGGNFHLQLKSPEALWRNGIRLAPWISLLALLSQSEVYPIGRILAPFYALLPPLFLTNPAHESLVKKCWWRAGALIVFAMAAGPLIVSPARPLFPALTMVEKFSAQHPQSKLLARMKEVYSVYRQRNDAFAPAKEILPADLKILGLVTYDDPETSLWRPFGSRQIVHVCPGDTADDLKARGVEYILVSDDIFKKHFSSSLDNWLKKMNAQTVQKISLNLRAATGPAGWYLIKLD